MDSPKASGQLKPSLEGVGGGVAGSSNEVSPPDPRWPYLSRWKDKTPPPSSVISTLDSAPSSIPPPVNVSDSISTESNHESTVATKVAFSNGSSSQLLPSLKGAWAKPLILSTIQEESSGASVKASQPEVWPSLSVKPKPSRRQLRAHSDVSKMPNQETYSPEVKEDGSLRFPWAARINQSTRNLYRTTTPTYMDDGTPKVTIPSHILLHGPENQKEYVIGQFYRCVTPSGGLIHAVVNRLWGKKCRIFSKKLGDSSFLFHIPDASTRSWILQRSLWHVDGCLMFVAPWSSTTTLALPEINIVPVWVTLRNIPDGLYSRWGISQLGSGLGEPILTHKPRLDPTLLGEAKILVEMELDKHFPQKVAGEDKKGNISFVDVEYSWIPSKCGICGHLGHKESRCLKPSTTETLVKPATQVTSATDLVMESVTTTLTETTSEIGPVADLPTKELPITTTIPANITNSVPTVELVTPVTPTQVATTPSIVVTEEMHINELKTTTASTANKTICLDISNVSKPIEGSLSMPVHTKMTIDVASTAEATPSSLRHNHHDFETETISGYESSPEVAQKTRGGRYVKPTQKVQEMQWTTVRGRGNRGRGGRGS